MSTKVTKIVMLNGDVSCSFLPITLEQINIGCIP